MRPVSAGIWAKKSLDQGLRLFVSCHPLWENTSPISWSQLFNTVVSIFSHNRSYGIYLVHIRHSPPGKETKNQAKILFKLMSFWKMDWKIFSSWMPASKRQKPNCQLIIPNSIYVPISGKLEDWIWISELSWAERYNVCIICINRAAWIEDIEP